MIVAGDCVERMAAMEPESVDAVVTDPPYGLEFMGRDWDRLDGDAWRTGGGFSKPGIGDRPTAWVSFGSGDTANATCAMCGGRMRGERRCGCDEPDWRVKGKPLADAAADSRQAQGRKMQAWHERWTREALRVLKPGGYLLAFGGTRTYHRLASAVEDAGFEVRDCLMWLYGSGFPKSLNVGEGRGTALKPAHEPVVVARKPMRGTVAANLETHGTGALNIDACRLGWGDAGDQSAARKAQGYTEDAKHAMGHVGRELGSGFTGEVVGSDSTGGRWPANVLLIHDADCVKVGTRRVRAAMGVSKGDPDGHGIYGTGFPRGDGREVGYGDEDGMEEVDLYACVPGCPVRMLDDQTAGLSRSATTSRPRREEGSGMLGWWPGALTAYGDQGGASRFFYVAKASRAEREAGLEGVEERDFAQSNGGQTDAGSGEERYGAEDVGLNRVKRVRNHHPTVKPIEAMRWLVRLVTPPDGLVLDPFAGSGTTGCAAALEGRRFVGVERDPEYAELARGRVAFWERRAEEGATSVEATLRSESERQRRLAQGQVELF